MEWNIFSPPDPQVSTGESLSDRRSTFRVRRAGLFVLVRRLDPWGRTESRLSEHCTLFLLPISVETVEVEGGMRSCAWRLKRGSGGESPGLSVQKGWPETDRSAENFQ